jgi:predicted dehydrogenase
MNRRLRLGILGTGNIAQQFAEGVAHSKRCTVTAVGSRTQGSAEAFARAHHIDMAYGLYEALLADPTVEAVYVALPNSLHREWTLRALRAGKHVLCEKPLAVNAAEAKEMFDEARRQGLMLVEAFMYRSHPLIQAVVREVRGGAIGELKLIRTSFCFRLRQMDGNIRFSTELAGGALMDVGCYCTDFARLLADAEPSAIQGAGHLHSTGVDDMAGGTLYFPNDVLASFVCAMTVQTNNAALICGTEGFIEVPVPWKPPVVAARYVVDQMTPPRQELSGQVKSPPRVVQVDADGSLYGIEADDFARSVLDGKPAAVTKEQTLGNMRVLDELRRQVGLTF